MLIILLFLVPQQTSETFCFLISTMGGTEAILLRQIFPTNNLHPKNILMAYGKSDCFDD